jgi:hypothetical protein
VALPEQPANVRRWDLQGGQVVEEPAFVAGVLRPVVSHDATDLRVFREDGVEAKDVLKSHHPEGEVRCERKDAPVIAAQPRFCEESVFVEFSLSFCYVNFDEFHSFSSFPKRRG